MQPAGQRGIRKDIRLFVPCFCYEYQDVKSRFFPTQESTYKHDRARNVRLFSGAQLVGHEHDFALDRRVQAERHARLPV